MSLFAPSFYKPPEIYTEEHDLSAIEEAFSKKDYAKMVLCTDLFWQVFSKSAALISSEKAAAATLRQSLLSSIGIDRPTPLPARAEETDPENITLSLEEHQLTIRGEEKTVHNVKNFVEAMRKHFEKGLLAKEAIEVPFYSRGSSFSQENSYYWILGTSDPEDIIHTMQTAPKLSSTIFHQFLTPTLQRFCQSLEMTCTEVLTSKTFHYYPKNPEPNETLDFSLVDDQIKAFRIELTPGVHFLVPRKKVERVPLDRSLYALYKTHQFSDFSLITKTNEKIKVHALVLFANGGEFFQTMLRVPMKEGNQREMHLEKFSKPVVEAFVDFLYLGKSALTLPALEEKGVDLFELVEMAHTYQVHSLIDCCIPLVTDCANRKDLDRIKEMAELYKDDLLEDIYHHLILKRVIEEKPLFRKTLSSSKKLSP